MENISILDQILNNQKAEEVARLDAVEIIDNLFGELSERERDVLVRRYGLHGQGKETLEAIGAAHQLTRERIRQIETSSVRKLQQLKNLEAYIATLKKVIYQLLEEHGGLMEREYLLDILVGFSVNGGPRKEEEESIHKNYLNFMITKLLHKEFEEIANSRHFKHAYKLKYQSIEHFEELIEELIEAVKEAERVRTTREIIDLIKGLESHARHEERFGISGALDISKVLVSEWHQEDPDLVNRHKPLYSALKAAKRIEQNKFGHWGIHNWRDIRPKTINDKIYLVLKNEGKPVHFAEIADKINAINFDAKRANAATVHNELILDGKYVLVGRGLYGLKDWGYKKGTVVEVIEEILADAPEGLTRDQIIDRVLERRLVKKATIILALMNKDKFAKANGRYAVAGK